MMTSTEILPDGRAQLNVFNGEAWTTHVFDTLETLEKYYAKATKDWRIDVV